VIALAGQPGRVTVATNMAAGHRHPPRAGRRGKRRAARHPDEYHESRRIDRQLFGAVAGRRPGKLRSDRIARGRDLHGPRACCCGASCGERWVQPGRLPGRCVWRLRALRSSPAERRSAYGGCRTSNLGSPPRAGAGVLREGMSERAQLFQNSSFFWPFPSFLLLSLPSVFFFSFSSFFSLLPRGRRRSRRRWRSRGPFECLIQPNQIVEIRSTRLERV